MLSFAHRLPALLAALLVLLPPTPSRAAEHDGITLPDSLTINGKSLVLNGLGTRRVTIFGLSAYVAGLYVTEKSGDAQHLLDSPDQKFMLMQLKRTVTRDDIVEAWTSGLQKNVENPDPYIMQLNAITSPLADMHAGEQVSVLFERNAVQLETPGNKKYRVNGTGFGKAMLSIWLGKNPPNRALKRGLLGQK